MMHLGACRRSLALLLCCVLMLGGCERLPGSAQESGKIPAIPEKLSLNKDNVPVLRVYDTAAESVEEMDIETYIMGVVAGEMKNTWPEEALKAQAILARTFTMKFVSSKESGYEGADISTDVTEAQAYNSDAINDAVREAVNDTRGMVMLADGDFPYAWFHAHSGGKTELPGKALEYDGNPGYLTSVESPESEDAPEDVSAALPLEDTDEPEAAEEAQDDISEDVTEPEEASGDPEEISLDETLPSDESAADLEAAPLTEEVSAMLAMADELIAHELPEPVVAPEPIEIPMPEPLEIPGEEEAAEELPEEEASPDEPSAEQEEEAEELALLDEEAEDEQFPEEPAPKRVKPPRSYKGLIIFLLVIALGLSLFTGGYAFYKFYYLQTVENISAVSSDGQVTVKLTTTIDDALLTVVCKDTYGNTQRRPVAGGKAVFDTLNPGTSYDFYVEISGLHSLVGKTKTSLTTAQQTSILNLSVVTGSEDGSAILSFTVQGPDSSWQVVCTATGEETKTFSCINHSATLTGLTPGVTYNMRLVPATTLYVVGQDSVTYTATKIIYAQDLKATDFRDNKLTVSWTAPADTSVESWTVRCYDNDKVDTTVTVTGTEAVFSELDPAKAYNIEVTAAGMTRSVTSYISANTVNVYDLQVNATDRNNLRVTWSYDGNAPESGWRVMYSVDGSAQSLVVNCESTAATLPLIPGSHYEISVQQENGGTVLDGTVSYDTPAAETFSGFWLTADNLSFYPCLPTDQANPGLNDVTHTDTFAPGAKASILMHTRSIYQEDFSEVVNLYVYRDSNGAVVGLTNPIRLWADMLEGGAGMLNLPPVPTAVGSYTVEIYFNGAFVASVPIKVSESPAA